MQLDHKTIPWNKPKAFLWVYKTERLWNSTVFGHNCKVWTNRSHNTYKELSQRAYGGEMKHITKKFVLQWMPKSADSKPWNTLWWPKLITSRMLQHSFYFDFYFEHLNFTWSYLIDMKISWSLDHIFWSYLNYLILAILSLDLIIWWWSKIHFFIWTLHYYLHAFVMPLTYVFHWQSTCILHMLHSNMLLPYIWHALDIHFTCVYLEDNTWTLVYNRS